MRFTSVTLKLRSTNMNMMNSFQSLGLLSLSYIRAHQKSSMEFSCRNLTVFQKTERIVEDVTVSVKGGEILGVIGHEVCGKTTFLSTLSGRHPLYEGSILINGEEQEYATLSRKVAFVTSEPLFLPTLTVRETIEYAGYLRLATSLPKEEKRSHIRAVESITGLNDCATLPVQLCSKFQKKCVGIACELLQCTGILSIDEPFAGLSCNDCFKMTSLLTRITRQTSIALVISLASPLNAIINRCSSVIFFNQGQIVYKGRPERLSEFLIAAGSPTPVHSSPAEHLMNLLSCDIDQPNAHRSVLNRLRRDGQYIAATDDIWVHKCVTENIQSKDVDETEETDRNCNMVRQPEEIKVDIEKRAFLTKTQSPSTEVSMATCRTSYWNQLSVLTARNFHNARRRILFPVSIIQNLYILVICVLIWWQPERTEETIKDRMGLFFFTVVQWAFFALLDAILTFPKEMRVILEEKQNKLYHTSAFCISKTISEIPLAILQPCVYMIVIYWVANLNSVTAFLGSLGVLIIDVLAAQSIGLFVGAALNPPWTISVVSLGLLSMMLWGGAFCTPPQWLRWGKFASYFTYGLNALITLEFQHAKPVRCGANSMVPICNTTHPATNETITHFPSEFVLLAQNITWSVFDDVIVLVGIGFTARLLWYFVLRMK